MGETTAISWCNHTFNPWIGCQKVSPACDGCFAWAQQDLRYHRVKWGGPGAGAGTRALTSEANWRQPHRWNRRAAAEGTTPFVFGGSLMDPFDKHVPAIWLRRYFHEVIRPTPNLVWLLLTKRPELIIERAADAGGLPPNVALGTTAEDQTRWDHNIGHLIAAKVELSPVFAFASCEPLLGPIWARRAKMPRELRRRLFLDVDAPVFDPLLPHADRRLRLDWIITGGETDQGGHKARPSHPDWFRALRDACAETGTAYHHKQNGEWAVASAENGHHDSCMVSNDAVWVHADGVVTKPSWMRDDIPNEEARNPVGMFRMGKARSGRLLDGVLHDARPEVRAA